MPNLDATIAHLTKNVEYVAMFEVIDRCYHLPFAVYADTWYRFLDHTS